MQGLLLFVLSIASIFHLAISSAPIELKLFDQNVIEWTETGRNVIGHPLTVDVI